jgi:hypothetical protein
MLDQLIHDAFDQMADSEQPPARVSIPQAIRKGHVRRRLRRVTTAGTPVLVAGAALAVILASATSSSPPGPGSPNTTEPGTAPFAALASFNLLVPYATFGWLKYQNDAIEGYTWPTAFRLIAAGGGTNDWTNLAVYAAGQCNLTSMHMSCGSAAAGTSSQTTLSGRAPDINGRTAYWVRNATGDTTPDIPPGVKMVAFQYARHGWALLEAEGTANLLRIATNVRYGQATPIRWRVQLTSLPPTLRTVQVEFDRAGSRLVGFTLVLAEHAPPPTAILPPESGAPPPRSLTLQVMSAQKGNLKCPRGESCPVINGHRVELGAGPSGPGGPTEDVLQAPDIEGVSVLLEVPAAHHVVSLTDVFTHHLTVLGPNPADWTTMPISP